MDLLTVGFSSFQSTTARRRGGPDVELLVSNIVNHMVWSHRLSSQVFLSRFWSAIFSDAIG